MNTILDQLFRFTNVWYLETEVAANTKGFRYTTKRKVIEVTFLEREGELKPHSMCSELNS